MMLLGLRNIAQMASDFRELLFYDIDRQMTLEEIQKLDQMMRDWNLSYILYSTKHGYHFISLTPMNQMSWGSMFTQLKLLFNCYYSGKTIRLSRKKDETQTLIKINTTNGEVIPNLYNIFASRFNFDRMPWNKSTTKYILHFEKYRSFNE